MENKTILVTGGGGCFGSYIAKTLAKDIGKVIAVDMNEEMLGILKKEYSEILTYCCNLSDYKQVEETVDRIIEENEKIDVLVNNAGMIFSAPLINILSKTDRKHNIEMWHKTMDANLNSLFYTSVCVVDKMIAKRIKGLIINISSISAYGNAGQSAYSAAKAAVNALTNTWSKELGMFNIRCAGIAPGFIDTESTRKAMSEAVIQKWEKSIPSKRLGKVEEVSDAVKFIINNEYFNGRIIELDGGLKI
ncbi:MAG: SDR family NAD(P)-dependent oxidoreductase [Ignavibacteriae bacterium]|nr:SDR family NAD(P)-dependent oxidoreductase [Ignavibacteriota bacterium]